MWVGKWKCAIELDENKLYATKYRENVWKNRGKKILTKIIEKNSSVFLGGLDTLMLEEF